MPTGADGKNSVAWLGPDGGLRAGRAEATVRTENPRRSVGMTRRTLTTCLQAPRQRGPGDRSARHEPHVRVAGFADGPAAGPDAAARCA